MRTNAARCSPRRFRSIGDRPAAVRYPRGSGPGAGIVKEMSPLPLGKAVVRRRSAGGRGSVAILAFGSLLKPALEAGNDLDATVVDMRFVKPVDAELAAELAGTHGLLVTVEENVILGGAGSGIAEALAARAIVTPLLHLGLPDRFVDHGDQSQLLASVGLDSAGIVAAVRARLEKVGNGTHVRIVQS